MSQPLPALRYLLFLAVTSLTLLVPYAVPGLWTNLTGDLSLPTFLQNPVESQRWFVIFGSIGLLVPLALLYPPRTISGFQLAIPTIVVLWFCYTLVRALLLPAPDRPVSFILLQSSFLFTFLASTTSSPSTAALNRFRLILIVTVTPLCLMAISQKFGYNLLSYEKVIPGTTELAKGKLLVASTFGHPNYMGSYLAPLFMLASGMISTRRRFQTIVGAFGSLTIIVTLFVAGTRGSLLALLLGTSVSLLLANRCRNSVLYGSAILIAIAAAGTITLADEGRLMASKEIAARAFYWDLGLQMFGQNPIIGIGSSQFDAMFWHQIAYNPETEPGKSWYFALTGVIRGVRPEYMHNDHLQVLVETGLVGALLWTAIWAMVARHTLLIAKSPSQNIRRMNASICGAIVSIAVDACFNFPFHLPCSGILVWSLLGLWAGWNEVNKIPSGSVKG